MGKFTVYSALCVLLFLTGCSQKEVEVSVDDTKDKISQKKQDLNSGINDNVQAVDAQDYQSINNSDGVLDTIGDNDAVVVDDGIDQMETENTESLNSVDTKSVEQSLSSIYFAFDKFNLTELMLEVSKNNYEKISQLSSDNKIKLEGNCDEWGTDEYNYALGLKRAKSVKDSLILNGFNSSQIELLSYGESNPICNEHTVDCWAQNRRVDHKVLP